MASIWTAASIIDLVFIPLYFIVMIVNIINIRHHGFRRDAGYILLIVVCLFKIVGGILGVVYLTGATDDYTCYIWAGNLLLLGFYPLLMATLSFIRKWLKTWDGIDPRLDRYLRPVRSVNIILFAGFILTIVGGALSNPTNTNANTGFKLKRAGDILFLICNVVILATVAWMSHGSVTPKQRYDPIIVQLFLVMPLMLIRMVYATVEAFLESPSNETYNIWIYLGLLSLPDFFATAIFTFCGVFWLRPTQRTALRDEHAGMAMEVQNDAPKPVGEVNGAYGNYGNYSSNYGISENYGTYGNYGNNQFQGNGQQYTYSGR